MRPKMIAAPSVQSALRSYLVPMTLAVVVVATTWLGDPARAWLSFDRAEIESGQVWRVFTAGLVHLGAYHAALNLLGLAALLVLCPERPTPVEWLRRLALLSLGTSAGLYWLSPQVQTYVGLSGVLHGLFVLGLWPMVQRRDLIATGFLLYLVGKLAWEIFVGAPLSDEQAIGGRVVTASHLFGTLAGLAYGLIVRSFGKAFLTGEK